MSEYEFPFDTEFAPVAPGWFIIKADVDIVHSPNVEESMSLAVYPVVGWVANPDRGGQVSPAFWTDHGGLEAVDMAYAKKNDDCVTVSDVTVGEPTAEQIEGTTKRAIVHAKYLHQRRNSDCEFCKAGGSDE